ncbi:MAG: MauE/DoxX family redox-associated membrane protein [Paraglaciecola chathamensis]
MLINLLLGLLSVFWIACAVHKLADLNSFTHNLKQYQWVPPIQRDILVIGLILAEALSAILLLLPAMQLFGLILACGLLLAYSGLIALNIYSGNQDFDCGCLFGSQEQRLSVSLLWRNAGILLLHVVAFFALQTATSRTSDVLISLLFGAVTLLVGVIAQQLFRNQSHINALKR